MTTSNGFLSRDEFLSATKRRFREVSLPGGKHVRIRSITAGEWADIETKNLNLKQGGLNATGIRNSDLRLIVATVCDGDGQTIFSDSDLPKLAEADAAMTQPLVREIREHCGLTKDVEDALKNCGTTGGGGLPSSSAEASPTT